MTELYDDFRDMLVALEDAGAEFLVVGGYAVSFHGHPRATKDLDVFLRPSPENAERVMTALREFGAPISQLGIVDRDFSSAGTVVQLGVPPVRIDLITEVDGLSFDEAAEGVSYLEVDGRQIPVIGKVALIRNKVASGRPQDVADVAVLQATEER